MKNFTAKIISVIFHPLLLPTYAVLLMFTLPTFMSNYQYEYKKVVMIIIFILTCTIPIIFIMLMLFMKAVNSFNLTDRRERIYPYALTTIIYITAYYLSVNFSVSIPAAINNFILISTIIIFILMLINFKMKVSAHMAGIGGFLSFFYVFFMKENITDLMFSFLSLNITITHFLVFIILLVGIIASSRLSLNAHNIKQISIGFFVGFTIGLINFFL